MRRWVIVGGLLLLILFFAAPAKAQPRSEKEVALITGLDGGKYEAYGVETVKAVQEALKSAGLYGGEVTGKLDEETRKALGEYQRRNGLAVSGVPTPRTRLLLLRPPVT
jgi:hypothetical protein